MAVYWFESGKKAERMPRAAEYAGYLSRMTSEEIASIHEALDEMIDGTEIQTAGWMPGSDWSGTPFSPIYNKAANKNFGLSGKIFGLLVFDTFMRRPEDWMTGRFEKDGKPIKSRTYFIKRG